MEETDEKFIIPTGALRNGDNVVTVVQVRVNHFPSASSILNVCRITWVWPSPLDVRCVFVRFETYDDLSYYSEP